jgi:hypothetical protein
MNCRQGVKLHCVFAHCKPALVGNKLGMYPQGVSKTLGLEGMNTAMTRLLLCC